jgi:hypothetical protein
MRRTAPGKTARAQAASREAVRDLLFEMEEPLDAAADLARALDLMGLGLNAVHHDDAGEPVLAVANALSDRIADAKQIWRKIMKAKSAPA